MHLRRAVCLLVLAASASAHAQRDQRQHPPAPHTGPVATVLGTAGFIGGWIVGTHRRPPKGGPEWTWPFVYGIAFAAAGHYVGQAIDVPIERWRNSAALDAGSCIDTATFVRRRANAIV